MTTMSLSLSVLLIPSPAESAKSMLSNYGHRKDPIDICSRQIRKSQLSSKPKRRIFTCNSLLPDFAPVASTVYGSLLLGGGLFAYFRSGSKGSLFGGLTGGALMASAYALMQAPETNAIGDAIGFGSAFLFSLVFAIRLVATRKLIPAGPLLLLSLSASLAFILAYTKDSVIG